MNDPRYVIRRRVREGGHQRVQLVLEGRRGRQDVTLETGRMYEFRYLYQGEVRFRQRECRATFVDQHPNSGYRSGSLLLSGRPEYGDLELPVAHIMQITEVADPLAIPFVNRKAPNGDTTEPPPPATRSVPDTLGKPPPGDLIKWLEAEIAKGQAKLPNYRDDKERERRQRRAGYTRRIAQISERHHATLGYINALREVKNRLERGELALIR